MKKIIIALGLIATAMSFAGCACHHADNSAAPMPVAAHHHHHDYKGEINNK